MSDAFVDAQVHADGLRASELATLVRFGVTRVVACAHDGALPATPPTAGDWIAQFDRLLELEAPRLRRAGISPWFALGVSPSRAPPSGLEALLQRLPDYLSHPAVVGLGTLVVDPRDPLQCDLLARQLELARALDRPVWIAPAPLLDAEGLRALASVVCGAGFPPSRAMIACARTPMIPLLRALDFTVALEPSRGRLSLREVASILSRHGPAGFVLTSHAGDGAADLLGVPATAAHLIDAGLSPGVVDQVARLNACRFAGRADAQSGRAPGAGIG